MTAEMRQARHPSAAALTSNPSDNGSREKRSPRRGGVTGSPRAPRSCVRPPALARAATMEWEGDGGDMPHGAGPGRVGDGGDGGSGEAGTDQQRGRQNARQETFDVAH